MTIRQQLVAGFAAGLLVVVGGIAGCTSRTADTGALADRGPAAKPAAGSTAAAVDRSVTRGGQQPAEDDTLLLYYGDDPDTVNLITSNDTVSTAFQREVYEGLADQDMANPDNWTPALAESWEFDPETLEYTFQLRRGVKWHPMTLPDGTPLPETEFTSRDVKFTFDCILNPNVEAAALRSYYEDPEETDPDKRYKIKVTTPDRHTVKVKWSKP
jgi:peptide/nickel transport system substrate-binding protein